MIVLVNPITKEPTAFEPPPFIDRLTSGPYQNVTEVSEEWVAAERERLTREADSGRE